MKRFWTLVVAAMLALPLAAQEVELRSDHPDEYVVREGDTLWDIAGRFLTRPWHWPAIWQANPQIDNPHLIYPGDRISLVYVDGQPRLVVNRGKRLSPTVRREPITGPITTVPLSQIEPFLVKPRVVEADALKTLPYIVANQETRFASAEPYRAFVRGLERQSSGDEVIIGRLSYQFERVEVDGRSTLRQNLMRGNMGAVPSGERPVQTGGWNPFARDGKILGYQLWEVARARVLTLGDPAQLEILDAEFEVRAGDYILPLDAHLYDLTFFPRAPDFALPGNVQIVGIHGGDHAVGERQIVAIDIGASHGVEVGHTFSVFARNREVRDEFVRGLRGRPAPANVSGRNVQLPEQYTGQIMVFRAFDQVSYALVMETERGVKVGDFVDDPDRRL